MYNVRMNIFEGRIFFVRFVRIFQLEGDMKTTPVPPHTPYPLHQSLNHRY